MTLARGGLEFRAGQLIALRGRDRLDQRDYTIASGEGDTEAIDVLYRLVPHGALTPQLVTWRPGDTADVEGPYGTFVVRDPDRPVVFVATGTGVAPARSFLRSHPGLRMTLLHGARTEADLFFRREFEEGGATYVPCLSAGGEGRVTEVLPDLELPADADHYLCGANEMIYKVQEILAARGVDPRRVHSEPYYYRTQ